MSIYGQLFRLQAAVLAPGVEVPLPSHGDENSGRRIWLSPPQDNPLPPAQAVIDAILELEP